MNLFVLSELKPELKHVGWSVSYTLEAILASTCNAQFIYPTKNNTVDLFNRYQLVDDKLGFLQRYRHRIFKSWFEILEPPKLGSGTNVLLVIGLTPYFLLSMHALGPLLDQFDLRVAYLLDGFELKEFDRAIVNYLDHVFVMCADTADEIGSGLGLKTTFLPLGADTLKLGSNRRDRSIDVIGYGRCSEKFHQHIRQQYNQQGDRFYFHSTFSEGEVHNLGEHVTLHAKLLTNSKISLCFEASNVERFQGRSPLLYRWLEGWAAGCNIVGKRPFGKGVSELMDWENSTYEIPDDPSSWVPFLEELLNDEEALLKNSQRNYCEALLRHDWRYRIRDMFKTLYIPTPKKLCAEIAQLEQKAEKQNLERLNSQNWTSLNLSLKPRLDPDTQIYVLNNPSPA